MSVAALATASASLAGVGLGIVRTKITALAIGSAGLGIVAQVNVVLTALVGLASLGLGKGAIRELARSKSNRDELARDAILSFTFRLPFLVSLFAAAGLITLAPKLSGVLLDDASNAWMLVVVAIAVPAGVLVEASAAAIQGDVDLSGLARINTSAALANTLVVALAVSVWGLHGAVWSVLATTFTALAIHVARRPGSFAPMLRGASLKAGAARRGLLSVGGVSFVVAIGSVIADLVIRTTVVRATGLVGNGLYQPAAALSAQVVALLLASFSSFLYPSLSSLVADPPAFRREHELGLRLALVVSVPTLLLLLTFREVYVQVFFSAEFRRSADVILVQLPGDLFRTVQAVLVAALVPTGRLRQWVLVMLLTHALNVAGAVMLSPTWGTRGVGLAYTLAWAASCLVAVVLSRRDLSLTRGPTGRVVLATALLAPLAWVVAARAPFAVAVAISAAICGGWLWLMWRVADLREEMTSLGRRLLDHR